MKKAKLHKANGIAMLVSAAFAMGTARAADAPAAADAAPSTEGTPLESVIVTGTRVTGVKAEDSVSPIQILDLEALTSTGQPDVMQALGQAMPSM